MSILDVVMYVYCTYLLRSQSSCAICRYSFDKSCSLQCECVSGGVCTQLEIRKLAQ